MEKMTQTPPPAHAPAGTSWVHCRTLVALAQVSDGDVQDALLAGARALCRKQIHRERNKASRKARGLPEYRTPDGVAEAMLGNPPFAGLGSGGAEVLGGGTGEARTGSGRPDGDAAGVTGGVA